MPVSDVRNMDCMLLMKEFPDKFFDLAICDIEYGIDVGNMAYLKENKTTVKQKNGSNLRVPQKKYDNKDWDLQKSPPEYFKELYRVSKNQIIWGVDYYDSNLFGPGRIKWDKMVPEGVSFKSFERAYCSFIAHEETIQCLWSGMMQAKSSLEPTVQQANKKKNEKRIHPTQKPVILYEILLNRFSKRGEKVIDTHLGSGSHRIAAYKLGINFYATEKDKDYYDLQEKRYKKTISQPLFDATP